MTKTRGKSGKRGVPVLDASTAPTTLDVRGVTAGYGRSASAITDCSLRMTSERAIAVVGPNGAGKTTLLRVIGGMLNCRAGEVFWGERDITRCSSNERAQVGIVHVPEGRAIFGAMTVNENLAIGAEALGRPVVDAELDAIYDIFPKLRDRKKQAAGTLSGGEQRMLAIGRGLMSKPRVMMLDEPTLGLSPRAAEEVFVALDNLVATGIRVLLVEQNLGLAELIAEHAVLLVHGRVVWQGSPVGLSDVPEVRHAVLGEIQLESAVDKNMNQ